MATCDPETLLASSKCFAGLPQDQIMAIIVQLLCEIYNAGVGGGVLCGAKDPSTAPTNACTIYYNTLTGGMWIWDGAAWAQVIGGP